VLRGRTTSGLQRQLRRPKSIRLVSPKGNWNGNMIKTGSAPRALTIVGPGRTGSSIASAARRAGIEVQIAGRSPGPEAVSGSVVLLCVPDAAISEAAAAIAGSEARPRMVGHTSGATSLEPLRAAGASEGCFSLHPLQTIPDRETDLAGAPAAVAGTDREAGALATALAAALGMNPFPIAESDRALYHAAASMASNFLVTLEQNAAVLLAESGVEKPREVLAPLVRRSLENWIAEGPQALTGPIVRGDEPTVVRHREAIGRARPDLLAFYDGMADATRRMAAGATP
jgi:predicted short-subunit dehydrogenase-like oxidoreductase (DUF2520 family)